MLPIKPGQSNWKGAALWKSNTPNILIPLETNKDHTITGFVVLDDNGFPEGGQSTLFDYAGCSFRESSASLSIHRELADPTLEDGYLITLLKLANSIDGCNEFSRNHAVKTAYWSMQISKRMGLSDEEQRHIELSSKLHDVGKIVVPKTVLTKPSPLTQNEWTVIRRHPTFGAMIMKPSARLQTHIPVVRAHHEHFDGSGYPLGLQGEDIPIEARIISVADTYATMTEGRVYRKASNSRGALRELVRYSGTQFDPQIVAVMLDLIADGQVDDSHCEWESF